MAVALRPAVGEIAELVMDSATLIPDADLVRLTRAGNPEGFRALVDRHYDRCLRYAMRMLGDRADAEEAVQDAFVRAHRYLDTLDETRPFRAWLSRIVMNQCRTLAAARSRNRTMFVSVEDVDPGVAPHDDADLRSDLSRALMRLDPVHREALLLKYLDDWTYEEMAAHAGTGVSALKMRVKRAREQLEAMLKEGFGHD